MGTESAIPTKSRELVKARSGGRCERCPGRGAEWHHRRGRAVRGSHRHCPANGLWLCRTCHAFAHADRQGAARAAGLIVSRYVANPGDVPVELYRGTTILTCEGDYREVK